METIIGREEEKKILSDAFRDNHGGSVQMTALNWNIFKTKFHQREQASFESLAYMLFCYEHGITKGIFRFKNQTGIETEPIDHHGISTGFQVKFYEPNYLLTKMILLIR